MSTPQRNHACMLAVDPSAGAVLRRETLVVLEDHHHRFEDLADLGAQEQYALSLIFRESFAVLDALGWPEPHTTTVAVPLTTAHIARLRRRHDDLRQTNLDHDSTLDQTTNPTEATTIHAYIAANDLAAQTLTDLFAAFSRTMGT